MKSLKKITAIILCIAMCFGVTAAAADNSYEEAAKVLSKLQIMEAEIDAETTAMCTRGEFAVAVANALRLHGVNETRFFDVPRNYDGFEKISALCDIGIIRGDGSGNFHPERVITGGEAAVMAMGATQHSLHFRDGDDKIAMSVKFAQRLDVFAPGMTINGEVTMQQAIEMIYRMMYVKALTVSGTDAEGGFEYTEGNDTLFELNYGIKAFYGTIDGIYGTSLNGDMDLEENEISINGKKYILDCEVDGYNVLGKEVKILYSYNKKTEESTVIYIGDNNRNKEIKIYDDSYMGFNNANYSISYVNNSERKTTESIERSAYIIYNGGSVGSNVASLMASLDSEKDNLEITLRDADGNGVFDVVIIDKYENYVVNSVDTSNKRVYGEKLDGTIVIVNLDDKDIDYVEINDRSGKDIEIDEIAVGSIISVFASDKNVKVVSSPNTVMGTLEHISTDKIATIDGKEYKIANELWAKLSTKPTYGKLYSASLDYFGKIARLEVERGTGMLWGYVVNGGYIEQAFEDRIILRILDQDGTLEDYTVRDNIQIDGISMKGETMPRIYNNIGEQYSSGRVKPQLIRFRANTKKEILVLDTTIHTSYEKPEDAISKTEDTGNIYFSTFKRFGFKTLLNNDTIIFRVPDIDDDGYIKDANGSSLTSVYPKDSDYAVVANTFTNGQKYTYVGYVDDTDKAVQDVLVYKAKTYNDLAGATPSLGIVTGFGRTLNDEGEALPSITISTSGGPLEYLAINDSVLSGVEEGDLVEVSADLKNNIAAVKIYYDYSQDKVIGWGSDNLYVSTSSYYAQPQISYGKAISIKKGVLKIGYGQTDTVSEAIDVSAINALVHDKRYEGEKSVYSGGMGDITTYEQVGNNCSKVFILTNGTQFRGFIVYR